MAQNLGVTCGRGDAIVVTKLISMEERDKKEADRLGNKGAG